MAPAAAEKIKEFLNTAGECIEKIRSLLTEKADFIADRFLGSFPEEKRRPIVFGLGGLIILFLILTITAVAVNSGKSNRSMPPDRMTGPAIPHEELFFPSEPDFLPEFLLEREPRPFWTAEDARPYWKNPGNSELWQREIRTAMDKFMEGVP